MVGNVVDLGGRPVGEPQANVVALLETLLGEARRGTIQQIAVAALRPGMQPNDAYCYEGGAETCAALIGCVELLKQSLIADIVRADPD